MSKKDATVFSAISFQFGLVSISSLNRTYLQNAVRILSFEMWFQSILRLKVHSWVFRVSRFFHTGGTNQKRWEGIVRPIGTQYPALARFISMFANTSIWMCRLTTCWSQFPRVQDVDSMPFSYILHLQCLVVVQRWCRYLSHVSGLSEHCNSYDFHFDQVFGPQVSRLGTCSLPVFQHDLWFPTRWCPSSLAKWVYNLCITSITISSYGLWMFMVDISWYIYSYYGL